MARIQVPKKGTFTCNSSTAEEAVEYLRQVSPGRLRLVKQSIHGTLCKDGSSKVSSDPCVEFVAKKNQFFWLNHWNHGELWDRPFSTQVGWALARQRAAILRSTEVGTQAAAAGIQCRFCTSVPKVTWGDHLDISGWQRCYGNDAILKGNRNKLRYVESQIRGIMSPWLSGVCELFVAKFRTSNSYRSNRAAGNHHRTAIIFAAWTQWTCHRWFSVSFLG